MIDVETKVFNRVYPKVAPLCAKNRFVSTRITGGTAFPACSMVEISNRVIRRFMDSSRQEKFNLITYDLNFYAMNRSDCRKLASAADEAMIDLNFTRISGQFIDNPFDLKVSRYVSRFEAMVDENGVLYRS